MNLKTAFEKGKQGFAKGLPTGLLALDKTMRGIQQKMIYGIAGGPKSGKSTFADFSFLLSPFDFMLTQGRLDEVEWIYYSFEIDRISKEFKFACYYMGTLYGVFNFKHKNKYYDMSPDYLMGKLIDDDGETIIVQPEHEEMLKFIYVNRIIHIFGEYNEQGEKIARGKVDFITHKENPTGLRKHLFQVAAQNGELQYENYNVEEDQGGRMVWVTKKKMNGYIPKDPKKFVIVITDHLRKIPKERGYAMKENVDKYLEYQVEMRDLFKFTFVDIIHTNRNMASVDRMKHSGEFLYPTGDDLKDTGNLSEDCNILFTVFNANDQKYNLVKHFGVELKDYPRYRSIHIVESRDTDCPAHFQTNMWGGSNIFNSI